MKFRLDGPCLLHLATENGSPGKMASYFAQELAAGESVSSGGGACVRVQVSEDIGHLPQTIYGVSGGRTRSGRFVVPDGAGHWCGFDPRALRLAEDMDVDVDLCCDEFNPSVLLDWVLLPIAQFAHAAMGISPLHASAAAIPSDAAPFVFAAWSGVGKTNLVLHAMLEGGGYFGDDRVHVDIRGQALPSSRRVSIYGYNRLLAPSLAGSSRRRLLLGDALHRGARKLNGRAGFVLSYVANGLGATRAGADELGGCAGDPGPVQAHVLCVSSSSLGPEDDPIVEELPRASYADLARGHAAVMEYEFVWFQRFLQTWRWAESAAEDPWRDLTQKWECNLRQYFERVPRLYLLTLPHGSPASVAPRAWGKLLNHASK